MGTELKICAYWILPAGMASKWELGSDYIPVILYNCWPLFTDRKEFLRCFQEARKHSHHPFFHAACCKQVQIYSVKIISYNLTDLYPNSTILYLFLSLKEEILLSDHTLLGKFILTDLDGGIRLLHHSYTKYLSKSNLSLQQGIRTV